MNVIQDRMTLSDQFLEPIMNGDTLPTKSSLKETYKPRESVKSEIVKELTNKFFVKENPKELARESDKAQSEEMVSRIQSSAGSSVKPDSSSETNL